MQHYDLYVGRVCSTKLLGETRYQIPTTWTMFWWNKHLLNCFLWFLVYFIKCIQCTQPSFYYLGESEYRNVKLFLESEQRCKFNPFANYTDYFTAKTNAEEIQCKILLQNLWPDHNWYEVSGHHVQYYGFGAKHTFNFTKVKCSSKGYKEIGMLILCQDQTDVNPCTTTNTSECYERKHCRSQPSLQQKRSIPKKKLYEECKEDDQCSGTPNADVCRQIDNRKLCLCNNGYVADQRSLKCQKVKKMLYEECKADDQCSGTPNAGLCKQIDHRKLCFCNTRYVADHQSLKCREDNRYLGESCKAHIQCSGTENANVCGENETCKCNKNFVRTRKVCLPGNLSLGQSCKLDLQCKGTENGVKCLHVERLYGKGFVQQRLKCLPEKRRIGESCEAHLQCRGTENANVCGENHLCTCNKGLIRVEEECVSGNLSLGQSCTHNLQCTGTINGERCLDGECFCEEGFVLQRLKCLQGNLSLGQSCTHNVQCTGTEHGERCLNGGCTCEEAFVLQNDTCIHVPNKTMDNCIGKGNWLFASTGVGVFGTFVIYSSVLLVLKRRKSGKKRLNHCTSRKETIRNIQYSLAEGIDLQCVPAQDFSMDYYSTPIDNIYNELHQKEKEQESENVYDASQPQCSYRKEGSETNVYTYNHLHEKPIDIAESIYDDPNAIPLSSFSTIPVEKF